MRAVLAVCVVGLAVGCGTKPAGTTTSGASAAPRAGEPIAKAPAALPNPKFNPNDLNETVQWLHAQNERERTFDSGGNDFANTKATAMAGVWQEPLGKEVSWAAAVERVTEKGQIILKTVSAATVLPVGNGEEIKMVTTLIVLSPHGPGAPKGSDGFLEWRGSQDELRSLRSGSAVRIAGRVRDLRREYSFGTTVGTHTCAINLEGGSVSPNK